MKVSKNNRYYCHRKLSIGYVVAASKTIYIPFNADIKCKYAKRLRDVYGYSVQLQIT